MIRVVVVEDSPTARALLVSLLADDPDIQVVGEAADGLEGVALTQKLRPDVVTMDVHMPRLDGLAATKELMITAPTPIVIVTGSSSSADVGMALHTLRAGAVALLHKPEGPGSAGFEEAAQKLRDTVKAMASVKVVRHWRRVPTAHPARVARRGAAARNRLIVMAASTGGPEALQRTLSELPGDFAAPVAIVQHITPGFIGGLVDWLNSTCDLRVKVAEQGETMAPHTVYLAPDDRHLGVTPRGTVVLSSGPPVGGFRPAATYLFESAAAAYGPMLTAVILTGMGQDGVEGLRAVRRAGGRIIAQDEKSSVVWGMPGAALAAGLPDLILPLEEIASLLVDSQ